jgi:putative flippase GtrA
MSVTFWKIIRFGLTGTVGVIIDFGITWLCREKLKWNKYIANSTGFILAATNNYILNRIWTFQSANPNWQTEFGKFLAFSLAGLALNNFIVYILNGRLKLNFYLSKLIATLLVFAWNFTMNYYFNFK